MEQELAGLWRPGCRSVVFIVFIALKSLFPTITHKLPGVNKVIMSRQHTALSPHVCCLYFNCVFLHNCIEVSKNPIYRTLFGSAALHGLNY